MSDAKPVPETPRPAASHGGPGAMVRAGRERAGLSQDDLAAQMHLNRATLDALERDDPGLLAEKVYVRGYYRKLSTLLGIPEAELMGAYERLGVPQARSATPPRLLLAAGSEFDTDNRMSWKWMLLLPLIVAAIAVGVISYKRHQEGDVPPVTGPVPAPVETPATSAASAGTPAPARGTVETPVLGGAAAATTPPPAAGVPAPGTPAGLSATTANGVPISTTSAILNGATAPTAGPAPGAVPAAGAPAGTMDVSQAPAQGALLSFREPSWVEVKDARGRVFVKGQINAGEARPVTGGTPPYTVYLGNAPGVDIAYNGAQVSVADYVKPNKTARFTLN